MLIFVSALNIEAKYLIKKLHLRLIEKKNKYQNIYFKDNIYVIITGIGWKNVEKMLNYFFRKYNISKDDRFILIGTAGAVDIKLKIGDILNPGIIQNKSKLIKISDNYNILYDENKPFYKKDKISLKKKYPNVMAVDMESFKFVTLMKQYNIRNYEIIKVISDTIKTEIPSFKDFSKKLCKLCIKKYFIKIKFKYNVHKSVKKLYKYLYKNNITIF